jgi:hypothetical protein
MRTVVSVKNHDLYSYETSAKLENGNFQLTNVIIHSSYFSYSNTLPLDTVLPFVIEDGNMAAYSKIKLIQIKEDYWINENITELGHIIYGGYSEFSWKEK